MFSPTQRLVIQAILIIFLYCCLIFICLDFLFTRSLMGSIHSEVSHAALKLHLDYHNLQNLKMILRKLKRRNQSFHRDPLTPVNLYRAPGSPSWQGQQYAPWIFLMETITCIQHDKRLKVKNFYPASKMSSKMSGSTVIKKGKPNIKQEYSD